MFFFRADGNQKIGSGHIMRCSSIAEALMERGEEVTFVLADDCFEEMLREKGFPVYVLHSDYTDMDSECETLLRLIREDHIDTCIVDSYYVTDSYFEKLRNEVRTVYLDDLMDHAWPVDVLINYNIYAEESEYEELYHKAGLKKPEFVLGCSYAPLRKEFRQPISYYDKPDGKETSVFVSSGGADAEHMELRLLKKIAADQNRFSRVIFHFIVGRFNRDWEDLQKLAEDCPNVILHRDVTKMKEIMCQCDLAVSASGSTLYELCCCKIPIITYVIADNQIRGAHGFEQRGAAYYEGDSRQCKDLTERILHAVLRLKTNAEVRREMSHICESLVDGRGAERIAEYLA